MKKIKLGIIGMGSMGRNHANNILAGAAPRCELTAVADAFAASLEPFKDKVKTFTSGEDLIRSGEVEAVLIATPHYFHTSIGIDALEQGLHVLVEKPISVHKADCERLIAASEKRPKQVFAAMFNMRPYPVFQKLKSMIDSGELGAIRRLNWIVTTWFRSDSYYASGGWRATWAGEGGGVLLNQCPHNLDLFQWLFGMPSRVHGFCRFGQYHDIEVEDDVTAYLEYADGKTGIFITTTGEAPGTNRLEVTADRGRLIVENNRITFDRTEVSVAEFNRTTQQGFGTPPVWHCEIPLEVAEVGNHMVIVRNFADAILDGTPLIAPGAEGLNSVELANAITYSTFTGKPVDMPLDGSAYEAALQEKIAQSKPKKKKAAQKAAGTGDDFSKSFG